MLLLTATTDKLQLVTSSAAAVDVHASFMNHTTSTDNVVGARQNTAISSATTTDIVAAPSSGDIRNVKTLHIRNKDASTSVDVTVVFDQNGTDYELHKATLRAGETLEYIEGIGFFTIANASNPTVRTFTLGSDDTTSSATPNEVAGLTVPTGTGTFVFQYFCYVTSAATTTGHRFSVNHDGTTGVFMWHQRWVTNVSAASDDVAAGAVTAAAAAVVSAFAARAKTVAGSGTWTDVDTAGGDILTIIEGMFTCSVDGNLELWHGSEVAAAASVKAGSSLILTRTGD